MVTVRNDVKLCLLDLLNITAAPNNGTRGSLSHLLKEPPDMVSDSIRITCGSCSTVPFVAYNISSRGDDRVCPYSQVMIASTLSVC